MTEKQHPKLQKSNPDPKQSSGEALMRFFGIMPRERAEKMLRIIDEECEFIDETGDLPKRNG